MGLVRGGSGNRRRRSEVDPRITRYHDSRNYTRRDPEQARQHALNQLHRLGYDVTLSPIAATA